MTSESYITTVSSHPDAPTDETGLSTLTSRSSPPTFARVGISPWTRLSTDLGQLAILSALHKSSRCRRHQPARSVGDRKVCQRRFKRSPRSKRSHLPNDEVRKRPPVPWRLHVPGRACCHRPLPLEGYRSPREPCLCRRVPRTRRWTFPMSRKRRIRKRLPRPGLWSRLPLQSCPSDHSHHLLPRLRQFPLCRNRGMARPRALWSLLLAVFLRLPGQPLMRWSRLLPDSVSARPSNRPHRRRNLPIPKVPLGQRVSLREPRDCLKRGDTLLPAPRLCLLQLRLQEASAPMPGVCPTVSLDQPHQRGRRGLRLLLNHLSTLSR